MSIEEVIVEISEPKEYDPPDFSQKINAFEEYITELNKIRFLSLDVRHIAAVCDAKFTGISAILSKILIELKQINGFRRSDGSNKSKTRLTRKPKRKSMKQR